MRFDDGPLLVAPEHLGDLGLARGAMIAKFGARCAAWLVNHERRRILRHRDRCVRFLVSPGADLPPWFEIAFCFLRDHRSGKWETSKAAFRGSGTSYVVRWVGSRRPVPSIIRPAAG